MCNQKQKLQQKVQVTQWTWPNLPETLSLMILHEQNSCGKNRERSRSSKHQSLQNFTVNSS